MKRFFKEPSPQARPHRARLRVEPLEDRWMPAVVSYTSATALLDFTAAASVPDTVTVTSPTANRVVIQVDNGDSITLTGDAVGNPSFTLSSTSNANDTLTTTIQMKYS